MDAAVWRYTSVSCLLCSVWCLDPVSITFSDNPVYHDKQLNMTCSYPSKSNLVTVTLEGFNGTRTAGSLSCSTVRSDSTFGTGVFANRSFFGCPQRIPGFGSVIVSMEASLMLELDYNCTVKITDGSRINTITTNTTRLEVRVLPSVPKLVPQYLLFNESDNVTVSCESTQGKPSAAITLTVTTVNGEVNTGTGSDWVSLKPSTPRTWHNATVLCNVTNHISPNMTAEGRITVNHIYVHRDKPIIEHSNKTLDCSDEVASYPNASYSWSIPASAHSNESSLNSSRLFVQPGQTGLFLCNATNIVTSKTVVVTYDLRSTALSTHGNGEHVNQHYFTSFMMWSISVASVAVLVTIIVVGVSCKLGYFRNRGKSVRPGKWLASRRLNEASCGQGTCEKQMSAEHREVDIMKLDTEDRQYQSLDLQTVNEPNYAQFSVTSQASDSTAYYNFQL